MLRAELYKHLRPRHAARRCCCGRLFRTVNGFPPLRCAALRCAAPQRTVATEPIGLPQRTRWTNPTQPTALWGRTALRCGCLLTAEPTTQADLRRDAEAHRVLARLGARHVPAAHSAALCPRRPKANGPAARESSAFSAYTVGAAQGEVGERTVRRSGASRCGSAAAPSTAPAPRSYAIATRSTQHAPCSTQLQHATHAMQLAARDARCTMHQARSQH